MSVNIFRFYQPDNPECDYRDYSQQEIEGLIRRDNEDESPLARRLLNTAKGLK